MNQELPPIPHHWLPLYHEAVGSELAQVRLSRDISPLHIRLLIEELAAALVEIQSLKDKLSVELQALADKDKNEVFYLERIADLDSQLEQLKAGYKELEAEVAKLNGLLERCQADAEKIAERNQ